MQFTTAASIRIMLFCSACILSVICYSQSDSQAVNTKQLPVTEISEKSLSSINGKYEKLTSSIDKQSYKLLTRMQKREERLHSKVALQDSAKAAGLFSNSTASYQQLQDKLKSPVDKAVPSQLKEYIPNLDSLGTSMNFLKKVPGISPEKLQQVTKVSEQLQSLQGQLQKANEIKEFVRQREQQLKEQLANSGLAKELKGVNKEIYYYQQQLVQYKELIKDRKKLEEKTIATIREIPAFKSFFQKNSYLSQLFRMPGAGGSENASSQALEGLQTRAQVQQLIQERLGSSMPGAGGAAAGGGSPEQYMQQQVQAAQQQLNQLKDKLANSPLGADGGTMPDFKPNSQKTKSILQRLEYGLNIQTQGSTNFLPATTDIALLLGYKLSDKASLGIGIGYKVGLGRGWNHISLSNQGVSIRSYIDIKAKGSIWISGGFEYQYLKEFENFRQIKNLDLWQKSALLGITKKYKIGKKKEGKMQLLWDALAGQQVPRGPALKFRVGWSL